MDLIAIALCLLLAVWVAGVVLAAALLLRAWWRLRGRANDDGAP